jgi:hypothetical protein
MKHDLQRAFRVAALQISFRNAFALSPAISPRTSMKSPDWRPYALVAHELSE